METSKIVTPSEIKDRIQESITTKNRRGMKDNDYLKDGFKVLDDYIPLYQRKFEDQNRICWQAKSVLYTHNIE